MKLSLNTLITRINMLQKSDSPTLATLPVGNPIPETRLLSSWVTKLPSPEPLPELNIDENPEVVWTEEEAEEFVRYAASSEASTSQVPESKSDISPKSPASIVL